MKTFIFSVIGTTLLILNTLSAFSQRRISFSANLAPVYSHSDFSTVIPNYTPNNPTGLADYVVKSNGLNYSLGLMGWYNFSPKWSVSTGVWATHQVISKATFSIDGVISSNSYKYNHPFANLYKVPLLVNYRPSPKKVSPLFTAGVSFDFRGKQYVDLMGDGEYVGVKFGKAVVVTPLIGAGLDYRLNDRLSLLAQPMLQYDVQSRPDYNYYHAYQLSLQAQLKWHL